MNPIARDTINVPMKERVVIRLLANNPGPWIFHCHIDYHLAAGMAMIFTIGDPLEDWPVQETESVRLCGGNEDFDSMVRSSWTQRLIERGSVGTTTVGIDVILSDIDSGTPEEDTKDGSSAATCYGVAIWIVSATMTAVVDMMFLL
ncbi:hypothetical protein ACHAWO_001742 [Cyclotella atomus]|jgi:hypothetical protein|uniref:Plastocyanin-like domain-containing protein n=1 Tax=Cyclotella atomus TaxID=382360 RepID=A0ABD3NML5_9STRA